MKVTARIQETFVRFVTRDVPDVEDAEAWFENECNIGAIDATEDCDDFSRSVEVQDVGAVE